MTSIGASRRRLERVLTIDAEVDDLTRQISGLVAESGTTLTQIYGLGPLVARRLIAEVVDVRRYPNRDAFASGKRHRTPARLLMPHRATPV